MEIKIELMILIDVIIAIVAVYIGSRFEKNRLRNKFFGDANKRHKEFMEKYYGDDNERV